MEAYKKLRARKSKHTHIKPPKKEKKKKPLHPQSRPQGSVQQGTSESVGHENEEELQQRKVYSRRKITSNAFRYELEEEESGASAGEASDRASAPSLKDLLERAGEHGFAFCDDDDDDADADASKDPSSHFRFREEREWTEIGRTASHEKAGLDFDRLGQSLATLPLAVRLQLEGDLFGESNKPEEGDESSEEESGESDFSLDEEDVSMNGTSSDREEVPMKSAQAVTEKEPPKESVAATIPPTGNEAAPSQEISEEIDLLEELLGMTSETTTEIAPTTPIASSEAAAKDQEQDEDLESWLDSVV